MVPAVTMGTDGSAIHTLLHEYIADVVWKLSTARCYLSRIYQAAVFLKENSQFSRGWPS